MRVKLIGMVVAAAALAACSEDKPAVEPLTPPEIVEAPAVEVAPVPVVGDAGPIQGVADAAAAVAATSGVAGDVGVVPPVAEVIDASAVEARDGAAAEVAADVPVEGGAGQAAQEIAPKAPDDPTPPDGAAATGGPDPVCAPIEAILNGECIPKPDCPAGVTEDLKRCAPVPTCEQGMRYVKTRRACVKIGEECGPMRTWVPQKSRCVVEGAECDPPRRWLPTEERCVIKGAECGPDHSWVPRKGRCVVKGTECDQEGMSWDSELERCKPDLPGLR